MGLGVFCCHLILWMPLSRLARRVLPALLLEQSLLPWLGLVVVGTVVAVCVLWIVAGFALGWMVGGDAFQGLTRAASLGTVGILVTLASLAALGGLLAATLAALRMGAESGQGVRAAAIWALGWAPCAILLVLFSCAGLLAAARLSSGEDTAGLAALGRAMSDLHCRPARTLALLGALTLTTFPLLLAALAALVARLLAPSTAVALLFAGIHSLCLGVVLLWCSIGLRLGLGETGSRETGSLLSGPMQ